MRSWPPVCFIAKVPSQFFIIVFACKTGVRQWLCYFQLKINFLHRKREVISKVMRLIVDLWSSFFQHEFVKESFKIEYFVETLSVQVLLLLLVSTLFYYCNSKEGALTNMIGIHDSMKVLNETSDVYNALKNWRFCEFVIWFKK